MDRALRIAPSSARSTPKISPFNCYLNKNSRFHHMIGYGYICNGVVLFTSSSLRSTSWIVRCAFGNVRHIGSLESLFCYDKSIPEEIIEKPVGLALAEKNVGEKPRCSSCQAKGASLCTTCSGLGLYVDSILESQGIIVKVRCLDCAAQSA